MATRNRKFASLSAILFAAFFNVVAVAPASAVTVSVTSFRGAWSSSTSYSSGMVVIYAGASYIALVSSKGVVPSSGTTSWAILDPPGATGATGPAGAQGPAGPQGAQGTAGTPGVQGVPGPSGPAGAQGPAGPTGPVGPAGATGAAGATGPTGPQGPAGTSVGFAYLNTWTSSMAYAPNAVVTESGTSYVALRSNTAVDPARDVSTSGGNWAVLAAAGAQGPAGPQGAQGNAGPAGPQGLLGAAGPMGPAGNPGATGPAGAVGPAGPAGPVGATGAIGPLGPAGPQGVAGPVGPQGPAGTGAAPTSCTNNITGPAIIQGDVVVPAGGYCSLGWVPPYTTPCCNPPIPSGYGIVQVTGKVIVGTGASLVVGLNSRIIGSIQAKGCNFVELVSEGNEEVDGDVQIFNCTGNPSFLSTGTGSAIFGSFQCLNNTGPCTIELATVGGSAQFIGNVTSTVSKIEGNRIYGNLLCLSNSVVPTNGGSPNTVSGSEQGQCVGL